MYEFALQYLHFLEDTFNMFFFLFFFFSLSLQNNDEKSLQKLTFRIKNCGIVQDVPALVSVTIIFLFFIFHLLLLAENSKTKNIKESLIGRHFVDKIGNIFLSE